jgi:2-methylcitrate dehydratase PrpD
MSSAIELLSGFAASLDAANVDAMLVRKAKDHLLDALGVACAGLDDPQTRAAASVLQRWGGNPEASVIGSPLRLPAPKAAFINTLRARIHTFDDTHEPGTSHPGSTVAAAALAAAEASHASGRALLSAVLAGLEVGCRVSAALGGGHYAAGFHSTGTCAPIGAAIAAARARGFDAGRTAAAAALAGGAAIGLRQYQQDGSMLDSALNAARGAELGVAAAEMAAVGLSGPPGVLDGRWGLLRVMAGGDSEKLTADLNSHWEFRSLVLKPFASCRFTHGPVATLQAAQIDHREVEAVEIAAFRVSVDVSDRPAPWNRSETILSHQLAAALALLGRTIVPSDLEAPGDETRALAARVRVVHDPALDAAYPARWPHRLTVRLRNGERLVLHSDHPPAADAAQARAKFRTLASPVLGAGAASEIMAAIDTLETQADLRPLLRSLRQGLAEAA